MITVSEYSKLKETASKEEEEGETLKEGRKEGGKEEEGPTLTTPSPMSAPIHPPTWSSLCVSLRSWLWCPSETVPGVACLR